MASYNSITGDEIKSKVSTKEYENNYDNIFRKESLTVGADEVSTSKSMESCANFPNACFCTSECTAARQKAIAQNGNVGYTVDGVCNTTDYEQVEKDYSAQET